MILGMSVSMFTAFHVALSFIGMISGLVVFAGMLRGKLSSGWTLTFLGATVLTSATGFPIPPPGLDPPRILGIVSLVLLGVAVFALYGLRLAGRSRSVYVIAALIALYLNCFVGVVQAFSKVPFLNALAPTQTEPPFAAAQVVLLFAFVGLGIVAFRRFRRVSL